MRVRLALLFITVLGLVASTSHADWHEDGVPVSAAAADQYSPVAVGDGAGGAIIAWADSRNGGFPDIYAQRLDVTGTALWTPGGRAVCVAASFQTNPVIASDGAGGAIIAWTDERVAGDPNIYAQRVNGSGDPQWTLNGVAVCAVIKNQSSPTIVADGAGGAVISWQDNRGLTGYDIFCQRLNASGVAQWAANGVALAIGALDQMFPVSVGNGLGGAIVAWTDFRNGSNFDVYFRPIGADGTPLSTSGGVPACATGGDQTAVRIASDGPDGGAIIVWEDTRSASNYDVYAQHVTNSGSLLWATNGIPLCDAAGNQLDPEAVPDGAGGAIVAWGDLRAGTSDVYAQRISEQGAVLWAQNGMPICGFTDDQAKPALAPDGAGGAVIVWEDERTGSNKDLYAQRVDSFGTLQWSGEGVPVSMASGDQKEACLAADSAGDALIAWTDLRGGGDIYAQRVEARYGEWGLPEPVTESISDFPGDQGGQVIVRWEASQRDQVLDPLISYYSLWRSTDGVTAGVSPLMTARLVDPAMVGRDFTGPAVWIESTASGPVYWEWVANQVASYQSGYSAIAPTRADSMVGDPATHAFKVLAHESPSTPSRIWESNVALGHSTDDLAPAAPIGLVAERIGSDVYLHWNPVGDADLREYAIYRSESPGVVPDPAFLVGTASDAALLDATVPLTVLYYVATAFDVHDNESQASNVAQAGDVLTAVQDPGAPRSLALRPNHPNPFTGRTFLQLGLPRASAIHVRIQDVGGRRIRSFTLSGARGWQSVPVTGVDDAGRPLPGGLYLYSVTAAGSTVRGRMIVVR